MKSQDISSFSLSSSCYSQAFSSFAVLRILFCVHWTRKRCLRQHWGAIQAQKNRLGSCMSHAFSSMHSLNDMALGHTHTRKCSEACQTEIKSFSSQKLDTQIFSKTGVCFTSVMHHSKFWFFGGSLPLKNFFRLLMMAAAWRELLHSPQKSVQNWILLRLAISNYVCKPGNIP